ncbi:glycosyltransferase family 2 protein [Polaribacter undariae]|uniref:Glycosyltransferase family 2 protein n=1 Tax=Polaribacter sejongensis TaxID=985043 RepID=A0AAJ1QW57_9FLAO|nr:glycosyltransferase family 2 protein [Polaribacter undariae]MDN3619157.1 glycosyltransferase family 2 protein [Polaribacter undariae]UWD33642.1 glycosyltransferase [Polaribacter undariae]
MKISIITVSYNSETTIETTLQSVVNQTYDNIEYIVVDGGSTDGTLSLIDKYKSHIDKWVSEPDKGIFDAMNKGIKMATGDVVGIINSDDLFNSDRSIEKVMNVFNSNIELDSLYADLYYVSQTDTNKIVRRWITGEKRPFNKGWHPGHPTFYVKKKVYDKRGLYNIDLALASDFEVMLRFIEKYQISTYYLKEPLVRMRLGGASNNSFKGLITQNIDCIRAFRVNNLKVNKFMYPIYRLLPKLLQFKK